VIRYFALLGIPSAIIFRLFIDETRGLSLEEAALEDQWNEIRHNTGGAAYAPAGRTRGASPAMSARVMQFTRGDDPVRADAGGGPSLRRPHANAGVTTSRLRRQLLRPRSHSSQSCSITGGTGFVDLPAGKGLGVLSSAEIYDPAEHRFMPIVAMKESRDHLAAAAIGDDKVLVAGGVNTLAVPLIVFPGPAMPWILRSAELFDPSRKQFVASSDMKDARDEATATTLGDGKVPNRRRNHEYRRALRSGQERIHRDRRDGREPLRAYRDIAR